MAITQTIATLPAVLNDSATFYEDIAVRNNSLVTVSFPSINTWATQANALAVEVNDKAAQVASQAVDGGYSQVYINDNFVNQDINTLTNKTTPVDADELVIADSDSSFSLKKLSFSDLKENIVPSGIVAMWFGSVISIPSGWVLCNGLNGTPNLTNRFVIGAGSSYTVGETGGSADAVVVSHTHAASTNSTGSHSHSQTLYNGGAVVSATGLFASSGNYDRPGTGTISAAGAHSHEVAVNSSGESGTNKNLPPYYALCYIMKT